MVSLVVVVVIMVVVMIVVVVVVVVVVVGPLGGLVRHLADCFQPVQELDVFLVMAEMLQIMIGLQVLLAEDLLRDPFLVCQILDGLVKFFLGQGQAFFFLEPDVFNDPGALDDPAGPLALFSPVVIQGFA